MATLRGAETLRLLALVAAALSAACGGEGRMASTDPFCERVLPTVDAYMQAARVAHPTPDDPRYGGTVVVGTIGELPDGMNAAVSADHGDTQHQQFVGLMTLIDYDAQLDGRPYLADSLVVAPDNRSITFHVRRDVRWHDGEQTDAHDVAFTYEVITNPLTAFPNAAFWEHYVKGPEGVEVVDDFTVRIFLEPHAGFLDPWRRTAILPEHLLGEVPPDELKLHPYGTQCPVGNGPFVFAQHAAQDRWVFEANPAFPDALGGRPFVDRYVYRVIPEQTTLLTELLTENIDVYIAPRPEQAPQILEHPNLDLVSFPARQYVFVGWNARRPQLADARVRRAITMGTNRRQIVQAILQGYGSVAEGPVPPFHWAYDADAVPVLEYDPAAARALLEESGWTDRDGDGVREAADGTRLELTLKYSSGSQQRQDIAEIMQEQLRAIGVAVRPLVVEWGTLIQQLNSAELRDFDGVVQSWVVEFKLDDTDLFHSARIEGPYAWSGTANPEIDRLLEELGRVTDREEARALWTEYQQILVEEQPYTFFYFPDRLAGVNKRVRGLQMDPRGEWLNIKDWYLDPASR